MFKNTTGIERVCSGGYCIGCGVCRAVEPAIQIGMNKYGEYVADLEKASVEGRTRASRVCPFTAVVDENQLSSEQFPGLPVHETIGAHAALFAGYSMAERDSGSSGGILTYILKQLLIEKEIDYAVQVRPRTGEGARGLEFAFQVASDTADVTVGSTSFYYPVTYSEVLQFIENNPGRYAITGVPCFHKALRLLKRENPLYRERIRYQLGLVCGQLKSALYFEYLLRKAGAAGEVEAASFRRKAPQGRADEYFFEAITRNTDGSQATYRVGNRQIGINWGMGLFKPKACDYCDDVFAETADIAVMDGWLPQYVLDGRGTSLIVVRDERLADLLARGRSAGELHLENTTADDVVKSQLGGINHRRKGLAYRLAIASGWTPVKRIHPAVNFPFLFKMEQIIRLVLRKLSRRAMAMQNRAGEGLFIFNLVMAGPFFVYRAMQKLKRIRQRIQKTSISPKSI